MNRVIGIAGAVASIVGLIAVAVKNVAGSQNNAYDNAGSDNKNADDAPKYGVKAVNNYTRDDVEIFDEVFDTEEEAEEYALECGGNFSEGAEVLDYADRSFIESSDIDFEVFEY